MILTETQQKIANKVTFGKHYKFLDYSEEEVSLFYKGDYIGYIHSFEEGAWYATAFAPESDDNLHITKTADGKDLQEVFCDPTYTSMHLAKADAANQFAQIYCPEKSYDNPGFGVGDVFYGNDGHAINVDFYHGRLHIGQVRKEPMGFIAFWNNHPDLYCAVSKDRRLLGNTFESQHGLDFYDQLKAVKEYYNAHLRYVVTGDNDKRFNSGNERTVATK